MLISQEFLDGASAEGVIYFSFGSCIRSIDMPEDKLAAFIETFRSLKQKVLWKFENDTMTNLPPNVMIRKWLPQSDILAHKNVKLFLTHGGAFGTQEGIYHGVPMVFIPIYSDQFRNAKRCVDAGYAEMLRFVDVTADNVLQKVRTVLNDSKYAHRTNEISALFRDNPIDPMEEAMYWIEFTARHPGTKVFKSNGANLPWYVHLQLDIVAALVVAIYLVWVAVSLAWKFVKSNRSPSDVREKKKKKL